MSNVNLTAAEKHKLNNKFGIAAHKLQLGSMLDAKVAGSQDGAILISGGFLTDSAHAAPAAQYGNTDADGNTIFTVTHDTQDGGYKIQLASAYVGKTVLGVVGSIGKGVAYNSGSPDLSADGQGALLDAPCINSETGEIWVVTQGADSTFSPAHFAGVVISFLIVLA